jgi:hypothetical protein
MFSDGFSSFSMTREPLSSLSLVSPPPVSFSRGDETGGLCDEGVRFSVVLKSRERCCCCLMLSLSPERASEEKNWKKKNRSSEAPPCH